VDELLNEAARRAIAYRKAVADDPIRPDPGADLGSFDEPFPEEGQEPGDVVALMDALVTPATMGFSSPRFYGWVIGGVYPVALAADWMTSAWDQNSPTVAASPGVVALESAAIRWIKEAAHLPESTWGAFVTGTTVAHVTTLAAARTQVLLDAGWDATSDGLFGAPPVTVVVGEEAHPTLFKALGIVGLGRDRVTRVPVDEQGRMRADSLPRITGPTILCVQAGNVNTGAFDPMVEIIPEARGQGAWVHVDGAFGFWAAVSERLEGLAAGQELADSWATDAHKYLNVPYDSGLALVRDPAALARVMSIEAAYLPHDEIALDPGTYAPELSRRARGVPTWAVLKTLGRRGLAELVERTVRLAQLFATRLEAAGFEILNDVVLNQVLVGFASPDETHEVIAKIQAEGVMFAGPTVWQGKTAMRISVSGYSTTEEDVERSVDAIVRAAS